MTTTKTTTSGRALVAALALAGAACGGARSGDGPGETTVQGAISTPGTLPTYRIGKVLQPQIVPIFWGDAFSVTDKSVVNTYLTGLARHMRGAGAPQLTEPVAFQYNVYGA